MARIKNRDKAVFVLFSIFFLCISCDNPFRKTLEEKVGKFQRPKFSDSPDYLDILSKVTITFDKSMEPTSLVLAGTMTDNIGAITWSKTKRHCDTMILSPKTTWQEGIAHLQIDVKDTEGWELPTLKKYFGVLNHVIYIDNSLGDPRNPGTKEFPVETIEQAIKIQTHLYSGSTAELDIAAGSYDTKAQGFDFLLVKDNLTIKGGFSHDWNERNPSAYPTTLWCSSPGFDIATITLFETGKTLVLDGVIIQGNLNTRGDSTAISILEGSTLINSCTITSNNPSKGSTAVILDGSSSISISNSDIIAKGNHSTFAIYSQSGAVSILASSILAQSLYSTAYGIYCASGGATITDTTINVSGAVGVYGIAIGLTTPIYGYSTTITNCGIFLDGAKCNIATGVSASYISGNVSIQKNTILLRIPAAQASIAINTTDCTTAIIENNVLFSGTGAINCGIFVQYGTASIRYNTIHGGNAGLATITGSVTPYASEGICLLASTASIVGNIIATQNPNNFSLNIYKQYGIQLVDADSSLISLSNNVFSGTTEGILATGDPSLGNVVSTPYSPSGIAAMETAYHGQANFIADSLALTSLVAEKPLSTTISTPQSIRTNNAPEAPVADRYNFTRTNPYTLGAVENDQE